MNLKMLQPMRLEPAGHRIIVGATILQRHEMALQLAEVRRMSNCSHKFSQLISVARRAICPQPAIPSLFPMKGAKEDLGIYRWK
jgi:hypothetical protein